MKTKEKILLCSLNQFNVLGEPHVTTLDVATELDISPGNLYYHYKGKDEIIAELYRRFDAEIGELQLRRIDSDAALLDMWTYLQFSFEIMARYLFIFRDISNLLGRYQSIHRKFNSLLNQQRRSLSVLCVALSEQGVLRSEMADTQNLIEHMTMTMAFWLNYQRVQASDMQAFAPNLGECAYQVMSLLIPYLEDSSREDLRLLAEGYL